MEQNTNNTSGLEKGPLSPNKQAAKAYSLLGFFVLLILLGQFITPILLSIVTSALNIKLDETASGMVAAYVGMYCIALPLGLLLLRRIPKEKEQRTENKISKISPKLILLMYPAGYTIMAGINILMTLFQTYVIGKNGSVNLGNLTSNQSTAGLMLFIVVIVAPTMEEIIFRYLPFKKASYLGVLPYVVWSAVCFGLLHVNLGQTLYATGMGFMMGLAMAKTKNIFNVIITHILINFSGLGLSALLPLEIYSIFIIVLLAAGIVCGIILIKTKMLAVQDTTDVQTRASIGSVFANAGTIIYCIICLAIIVGMFFVL